MRYKFILILIVILGLLFFIFVVTSAIFIKDKDICSDCNVILISIDTLRQDYLGIYGYEKDTSPNLDAYAKNGTVFTNFYSTSSWTLPAHASLFTSKVPSEIKVLNSKDKIPDEVLTITEVLKDNGYATHSWKPPNTYISNMWGFSQGFDTFDSVDHDPNYRDVDLIFPRLNDWLAENKNTKFFAFVHTMQVHKPYCPPKEFDKFKDDYEGGLDCFSMGGLIPQEVVRPDDGPRYVSLYDGEIAFTDYYLGQFFNKLKELGLDKTTIVVILSDHGEEFGERGRWAAHGGNSLYNELVKIPLVIKAPNMKNGVLKKNISIIDIAPTILDLLGIKKPVEFDGVSIRETIEIPLYLELNSKEAIIYDNWKLIADDKTKTLELYNLSRDPFESNNILDQNREKKEELLRYLEIFHKKAIKAPPSPTSGIRPTDSEEDKKTLENLKTLGY